jgi:hypothetical protein
MSTFIFVHGAWHGGWCWEKAAPLLRAPGHEVFASDLQGDDPTPIDGLTLGDWIDSVAGLIEPNGRGRPRRPASGTTHCLAPLQLKTAAGLLSAGE